ncbi:hypothetical protein G6F46_014988 [Rhizopus delemar]|nr:hypothetical protein G6F46_014988 [Rhizopus delemar]
MLGQQDGRDDLRADGPIQRVQGKLRQQLVGATDVGSRADQVVHRTGFFKQPLHLRFARHIHLMQAGRAKRPQRLARRIKRSNCALTASPMPELPPTTTTRCPARRLPMLISLKIVIGSLE